MRRLLIGIALFGILGGTALDVKAIENTSPLKGKVRLLKKFKKKRPVNKAARKARRSAY